VAHRPDRLVDDRLYKDDLITVVGTQDAVNQAIKAVGHGSSHSLIEDRKYLDFRRITVSDPKLSGVPATVMRSSLYSRSSFLGRVIGPFSPRRRRENRSCPEMVWSAVSDPKLAGRTIGELDIDSRFGAAGPGGRPSCVRSGRRRAPGLPAAAPDPGCPPYRRRRGVDRKYLDFRRITVSDPKLAGRTIGELDIDSRFGATISRVRRGAVAMAGTPGWRRSLQWA